MAMRPACGVGLQNALGAPGPPEVALHPTRPGGIPVDGAACGALRAAARSPRPTTPGSNNSPSARMPEFYLIKQ